MSAKSSNVLQALRSWRSLVAHLPHLSEAEVLEALKVESSERNRRSVIERLVKRATRLQELKAASNLKESFPHEKDH